MRVKHDLHNGCYSGLKIMLEYLFLLKTILCSTVFGQTFRWVNLVSPNYQFNPTSLHTPIAVDNFGNPVCDRLRNYHQIYSLIVYGDVKGNKSDDGKDFFYKTALMILKRDYRVIYFLRRSIGTSLHHQ